jgi:putative endonuclease
MTVLLVCVKRSMTVIGSAMSVPEQPVSVSPARSQQQVLRTIATTGAQQITTTGLRKLGTIVKSNHPTNQTVILSLALQGEGPFSLYVGSEARERLAICAPRFAAERRTWIRRNTGVLRPEVRPQDDSAFGLRGKLWRGTLGCEKLVTVILRLATIALPRRREVVRKSYYVYIMTNKTPTLYTGVTNDVTKRVLQHKLKLLPGFTSQYNLTRLAYFEVFGDIRAAITREKQIKGWLRAKKVALIIAANPIWRDLSDGWYGNSPPPS